MREVIIRLRGPHGNQASGHHQWHHDTDTISVVLTNQLTLELGCEGENSFHYSKQHC